MLHECCVADLKFLKNLHKDDTFMFVDRSHNSVLAPSKALLAEYKKWEKYFSSSYDKQTARDRAWNLVKYEMRYRHEMVSSSEAMSKIRDIARRVLDGENIWLICWEKNRPCHRFILMDIITRGDWR